MKYGIIFFGLLLSACATAWSAQEAFPTECRWETLVRVVDGDTIIVGEKESIRFIGIDTPEMKHPEKPVQHYALESSRELKRLLDGQARVCLISDPEGDKKDIYKRTLAYVFRADGLDTNAEMIKRGAARTYLYFPFSRKEEFRIYGEQARSEQIGLWDRSE